MSTYVDELRSELEQKKQEVKDLEAALRVLEKREGIASASKSTSSEQIVASQSPLNESGEIDFDKLELPDRTANAKPSLVDEAKSVIEKFGGREFTVNHVYAALKQLGKVKDAKHTKNRVSLNVRALTQEGFITRTHKGKGNDPHRYKATASQVSFLKEVPNEKAQ